MNYQYIPKDFAKEAVKQRLIKEYLFKLFKRESTFSMKLIALDFLSDFVKEDLDLEKRLRQLSELEQHSRMRELYKKVLDGEYISYSAKFKAAQEQEELLLEDEPNPYLELLDFKKNGGGTQI